MSDYKKLYTMMFNAATDAQAAMAEQNFGLAQKILREAQQNAEEVYLEWEED